MVSSLEWTILGDLPGLAQYLPSELTTTMLAGKSTGQIAGALSKKASEVGDHDVRSYVAKAGEVLSEAAELRNDVLHARPATFGNDQRLSRWKPADWKGPTRTVAIDIAWLSRAIDRLSELSTALDNLRPLHKHSAFADRVRRR